jgi:pyruvate dehydrogenase E1 component alpha subunit
VGHFLARGSAARGIAAEIMGKITGCSGGKGGQMHLTDISIGALPSNAIVGANIPIATGAALGFQLRGQDRVAVSFFGDGASNTGAFHEGINLAAIKDAPVIFVCENNQYGASTAISSMLRIADIADRAAAYGIPGRVVDGMDVLAVYQAALEAVERARQGNGPTLLECKTYRYSGHSRGDPGGYRSPEEVQLWRERDPIPHMRTLLTKKLGLAEAEMKSIEHACQAEVEEAVEFARKSPEPEKKETYRHVFAEDQ